MNGSGSIHDGRNGGDEDLVETATAWFVRVRAGDMTEGERRAFSNWLLAEPSHAIAYAEAEALWDEIGDLADPRQDAPIPPVARTIQARGRPPFVMQGVIAACLALAVATGFWTSGAYDELRADYVTHVGETRTVTLSDGSVIDMNTDTAFAVDFAEDRRRIDLYRGEAFFKVAKDAARPFDVIARDGVARAVGTAFDVRRKESAVTVAVQEGRVRVARLSDDGAMSDGVLLAPGEAATYGGQDAVRVAADPGDAATAWRQGKLVFADWPLRDVVAELDRYRSGVVTVMGSKIADARFTGVFDLRETDRALDAIEETLPVDVVRITPYLTVLRAAD